MKYTLFSLCLLTLNIVYVCYGAIVIYLLNIKSTEKNRTTFISFGSSTFWGNRILHNFILLVCQETIVIGADLYSAGVFFRCKITELRRPIATKFCIVIGSVFRFIVLVENFGGPPPKKGVKTM